MIVFTLYNPLSSVAFISGGARGDLLLNFQTMDEWVVSSQLGAQGTFSFVPEFINSTLNPTVPDTRFKGFTTTSIQWSCCPLTLLNR